MLFGIKFQITTISLALCCTLGEIACYVLFFHHCYTNDNGRVKQLLPPQVTRQRNRKNLISFLGQFYAFLTEIIFILAMMIIIAIDKDNTRLKAIIIVVKCMDFGLLSFIEIAVSENLWNLLLEDLSMLFSL